ncbi:MAG: sigma 54-interacting transcriptional regulator [Gammaproteobacteria bacterium]|nr:sigma 54-interacting transcriptional regulator [Gammaproteobacteria bacterium]
MKSNKVATTPEAELLVVQEAARLITRSINPEPAVQGILRLLSQLLGLNRGRVLLPDAESGNLQIRYAYGLTEHERARGRYMIGEGVSGRVYQSGQVALIQDIDDEPTYLARAVDRTTLPNEAVAFIAVPIVIEEYPVGVLAVHRLRQRERPFQRDVALLQVLATFIGQALRVNELIAERTAHLLNENRLLKNNLESKGARYGIMGQSLALQQAIQQALQVASTATTVLLLGESGTGKERFARMQHLASDRAEGPFVSINCAAIPATLIESELFGHEKGAFTGATSLKRGKIELASNGTLFLDEIGDLDLELQAKLLKVLEQKSIQRVGSSKDIQVDVRVVAATHKNLQEAVNENRFRLDLFYRLNIFPIRLPPLRARQGDVPILARYFLNAANQEYARNVSFGAGAVEVLDGYPWPGNIRQLENLIKRAVLMSVDATIPRDLVKQILVDEDGVNSPDSTKLHGTDHGYHPPAQPAYHSEVADNMPNGLRPYVKVRGDEGQQIAEALRRHQGNKTRAAMSLGMTPRQLRYRIKKLQLPS